MIDPRLQGIYPLADDDPRWKHGPETVVEAALASGISVIQLRLKRTADREALELARWAVARARDANALVVVNDRFDLADLSRAEGLHLGQDDVPPERVPRELRERLCVGLSTHDLAQAREAITRPVDAIAFGPVFGTASKDSPYDARGLDSLATVVRESPRPLVAIGGIHAENVADVARVGAAAAAVISAVADAPDPAEALRVLQERFHEGREARARVAEEPT